MQIDQSLPVHFSDDRKTMWIPLPKEQWRSCGKCNCPNCKGGEAFYDTLALSTDKKQPRYTWMVHYPELQHGVAL